MGLFLILKSAIICASLVKASTIETGASGSSYLGSFFWSSQKTDSTVPSSATEATASRSRLYSFVDYVNPLAYTSWWSSSGASQSTEQKIDNWKQRRLRPLHASLQNTAKILEGKLNDSQPKQLPDPNKVALVKKRLAQRPAEASSGPDLATLVAQQANRLYGDKLKIAELNAEKRDKRITKFNVFQKKHKKFADTRLVKAQEEARLRELQQMKKNDVLDDLKRAISCRAKAQGQNKVSRIEAAPQKKATTTTTTTAKPAPRKRFVFKKTETTESDFLAELKAKVSKKK